MNKYLFLLGDLPPKPSANGVCIEKIIKHLYVDNEKNVHCILWSDSEIATLYKYNLHFIEGRKKSHYRSFFLKFLFRMKHILNKIIVLKYFPVNSFKIAKSFYNKSIEVIDEYDITHVIAVSFPGETLYAINKLKRKYGNSLITIVYPLDVSLEGDRTRFKFWNKLSQKAGSKMMNKTIKINDYVLTLENAISLFENKITSDYHYKFKSVGIPLIENLEHVYEKNKNDNYIILYAGYLLMDMYNPIPILDLINRGLEKKNKKAVFDFYGICDKKLEEIIINNYRNLKFINHGWVTDSELNKKMAEADIYLNISKEITNTIPSKMFKYMCFKKPIIHYYFNDNDCCIPYLTKYGNALLVKSNSFNEDIIDLEKITSSNQVGNIEEMFPTCTPKYTADIIAGLNFTRRI